MIQLAGFNQPSSSGSKLTPSLLQLKQDEDYARQLTREEEYRISSHSQNSSINLKANVEKKQAQLSEMREDMSKKRRLDSTAGSGNFGEVSSITILDSAPSSQPGFQSQLRGQQDMINVRHRSKIADAKVFLSQNLTTANKKNIHQHVSLIVLF